MRLTRRQSLAALGLLSLGRPAQASMTEPDLASERIRRGAPALGVAWQGKRDAAQIRVSGVRAAGGDDPVFADARWHLGSLTKSMTATLAARAVEMGRIDWNSSIGETLGPLVDGMREDYAHATLLQLLSHRAGLPPDIPKRLFSSFSYTGLMDARPERLRYAVIALGMAPLAPPGAKMIYANSGYVVAGAMLEARLGAPWEALLQQLVLAPLGLTQSGFGPPEIRYNPYGHVIDATGRRQPIILDNPIAMGPAARVHMSLGDLTRYLTAHRTRAPDLLSRASWKTLHTPPFGGDYALGWIVLPDGRLWHNGSNGLWYAEGLIERQGVAALAQNDGAAQSGQPSPLLLSLLE